jgi:hypothetical protein
VAAGFIYDPFSSSAIWEEKYEKGKKQSRGNCERREIDAEGRIV